MQLLPFLVFSQIICQFLTALKFNEQTYHAIYYTSSYLLIIAFHTTEKEKKKKCIIILSNSSDIRTFCYLFNFQKILNYLIKLTYSGVWRSNFPMDRKRVLNNFNCLFG